MSVMDPRPRAGATEAAELCPKADPVEKLPILILNPHSRCNCRCVMCDIWKDDTHREISVDRVRSWIPGWLELGVERVVLSGGEAMMHTSIWELCGVIREAGIGITILTTGILLRRHAERAAELCDDFVVSLDGPADVHDSIRNVCGAYEKLANGVRAIKALSPRSRVTARCTVQRLNHDRLADTVDAARDAGVDHVSFLAADVHSEAFNHGGGWSPDSRSEVMLSRDQLPALADELSRMEKICAADFDGGFIAESPGKLRRKVMDYFAAVCGEGEFPLITCNAPWVSAVIDTDGSVRPCFFHPAYPGVAESDRIATAINSAAAVEWRQQLDVANDSTCRRCVCSLALRR